MNRWLGLLLAASGILGAQTQKLEIAPEIRKAMDRISVNNLKSNLSFLSSDLLEGRASPSRGLDLAAEFIAAQFRRAGLEPGGEGYFQVAKYEQLAIVTEGITLSLAIGDKKLSAEKAGEVVALGTPGFDANGMAVVKAPRDLADLKQEHVQGKVLLLTGGPRSMLQAADHLARLRPAALLVTDATSGRLLNRLNLVLSGSPARPMVIVVRDEAIISAAKSAPEGESSKLTAHVPASAVTPVVLRNVVGILRGSDAKLKDTAIILSAHYDHIGMLTSGAGDRINNGANDDGSGVVSVIEIASALAAMPVHPRRSVVFVTFFGEEIGGFGSKYFGAHPPFPLAKIAAHLNLEQVGRTDGSDAKHAADATFTGFDFSNLPQAFVAAGKLTGIKVYKDEKHSDAYFSRSDNQSLADVGVPAHTLGVTFEFPDYHRPGDEWQKIDYDNMAKLDKMIALGLYSLTQSDAAPKWNEANPKTKAYVEAAKKLHAAK